MRKLVVSVATAMLAVAVLALSACGSGGSQSGASSSSDVAPEAEGQGQQSQVVDVLPNAPTMANDHGFQMVSDKDHFFFSVGNTCLYQTDTAFDSAVIADDADQIFGLCEVDGVVYYGTEKEDEAGGNQLRAYDPAKQIIRVADTYDYFSNHLSTAPYGDGLVYNDYNDIDFLPANGDRGEIALGDGDLKTYQITTDGNLVYFTGNGNDNDTLGVYSFDPESPGISLTRIADAEEVTVAVTNAGLFFLAKPEAASDADDSSGESNSGKSDPGDSKYEVLELMYADNQGNVVATGIMGAFEERIFAYGDYVFYTRHNALSSDNAKGSGWRPCAFDASTNTEYVIDRPEYKGLDIIAADASGGYLLTDVEEDSNHLLSNLSDAGDYKSFWDLLDKPEESQALKKWKKDEEAAQAQAEREAQEAAANEPYGPGTSTLHLEAGENKSSCFKLVRLDGSVEFKVLLGPGESLSQSFPSGRYTLKIAEGANWISDEEAFGPDGHYSTTDVYTFEDGGSYEIGSGTYGDFSGDSQSGFTG